MKRSTFLKYIGLGTLAMGVLGKHRSMARTKLPRLRSIYKGHVKGYYYTPASEKGILPNPGDPLNLMRENNNSFDHYAIALYWQQNKLGYIARTDNKVLAKLIDAGYNLQAKVTKVETHPDGLNPEIRFWIGMEGKRKILRSTQD